MSHQPEEQGGEWEAGQPSSSSRREGRSSHGRSRSRSRSPGRRDREQGADEQQREEGSSSSSSRHRPSSSSRHSRSRSRSRSAGRSSRSRGGERERGEQSGHHHAGSSSGGGRYGEEYSRDSYRERDRDRYSDRDHYRSGGGREGGYDSYSRYPSSRPPRGGPPPPLDGPRSTTRLFVKNIAPGVSSDLLKHTFEKYGMVKEAFVLDKRDASARACGFVQFTSEADCNQALQALQDYELEGMRLMLEHAVPKRDLNLCSDRLYVGEVPPGVEGMDARLRGIFEQYGGVDEVILTSRPSPNGTVGAFVQMKSAEAAEAAAAALDRTNFLVPDLTSTVTFARKPRNAGMMGGPPGAYPPSHFGGPSVPRGVCKFFNTPRGCRDGNGCRFIHPAPDQFGGGAGGMGGGGMDYGRGGFGMPPFGAYPPFGMGYGGFPGMGYPGGAGGPGGMAPFMGPGGMGMPPHMMAGGGAPGAGMGMPMPPFGAAGGNYHNGYDGQQQQGGQQAFDGKQQQQQQQQPQGGYGQGQDSFGPPPTNGYGGEHGQEPQSS